MIKVKSIKPLFTALITTMDRYTNDSLVNGLIDPTKRSGAVMEYQKVLAIGGSVREIKVGDLVSINPTRFAVKKHKEGSLQDGVIKDNMVTHYEFDIVNIKGQDCLLLQDRDIEFIIDDFEEIPDQVPTNLVLPSQDKIIM